MLENIEKLTMNEQYHIMINGCMNEMAEPKDAFEAVDDDWSESAHY